MLEWLKMIPMDIDLVNENELLEPKSLIKKGEKPIGNPIPLPLRKLWTLYMKMYSEYIHAQADLQINEDDIDSEEVSRIQRLGELSNALKDIFWISVKDELKLWKDGSNNVITLRAGWQVVILPPLPRMPGIFRMDINGTPPSE